MHTYFHRIKGHQEVSCPTLCPSSFVVSLGCSGPGSDIFKTSRGAACCISGQLHQCFIIIMPPMSLKWRKKKFLLISDCIQIF